ncbi:MAG: ROK family transcriptional regulator [Candidatus Omnitrophica bacterium]|nr:ROK family transcriptional regulator [Candidatus Omnitrophota bacterium]
MKTKEIHQFTFHELSEKDLKSLKILDLVTKKGIISRTEISKITGINIVSVSNYIKKYIDEKLIMEKGFDVSTGGRKPELVELNKETNRVVGVEIGSDTIRAVLTDIGLAVAGKAQAPKKGRTLKEVMGEVCSLIDDMMKKAALNEGELRTIGVGTSAYDNASVSSQIREKFNVEVFVADEASCAAFGEKDLNKEIPGGDLLYMYSDIGCGVVVKETGERISGADSKYLTPWDEALGAVTLAKSDVARGVGTSMVELAKAQMENITVEIIAQAAIDKDEVAMSIMRSVGVSLGLRTAYLINLFDPKSVVIGGGIEKAGSLILDPMKKTVKKLSLKDRSDNIQIIPGSLGDEAVSLGAAFLAAREIFLKA